MKLCNLLGCGYSFYAISISPLMFQEKKAMPIDEYDFFLFILSNITYFFKILQILIYHGIPFILKVFFIGCNNFEYLTMVINYLEFILK